MDSISIRGSKLLDTRKMASYEEHCEDCEKILGHQWCVVHRWLDEMYKYDPGNLMHRAYRHHAEGINKVKEMWGEEAALAAEIHIRRDFPGLDRIPTVKDWEDPQNMIKNSDQYKDL